MSKAARKHLLALIEKPKLAWTPDHCSDLAIYFYPTLYGCNPFRVRDCK